MGGKRLAPETIGAVAERLKVLAEAARLSVLNELRSGPRNVSDLIEGTGLSQANLSKHLQLLHAHGVVTRNAFGVGLSAGNWRQFLTVIRHFARKLRVKARDVERALFDAHRVRQKGRLYRTTLRGR